MDEPEETVNDIRMVICFFKLFSRFSNLYQTLLETAKFINILLKPKLNYFNYNVHLHIVIIKENL